MQWYRHHRPAWQKIAVSPHTSLPKHNFSSQNFTNLTTEILPLKFYHSVLSIFPHFKSRTGIVSYSLKPKVITMPISPCITYLPQWMTELATPFYHANWHALPCLSGVTFGNTTPPEPLHIWKSILAAIFCSYIQN